MSGDNDESQKKPAVDSPLSFGYPEPVDFQGDLKRMAVRATVAGQKCVLKATDLKWQLSVLSRCRRRLFWRIISWRVSGVAKVCVGSKRRLEFRRSDYSLLG